MARMRTITNGNGPMTHGLLNNVVRILVMYSFSPKFKFEPKFKFNYFHIWKGRLLKISFKIYKSYGCFSAVRIPLLS